MKQSEVEGDGHRIGAVDPVACRTEIYNAAAIEAIVGTASARLGRRFLGEGMAGRIALCVCAGERQEWPLYVSGSASRWCYSGKRKASAVHRAESDTFMQQEWEGDPLDIVREWMKPYYGPRLEAGPKWIGGCAGFWGYDVVRTIERLPELAADDTGIPDYMFMRMNELWIIDHQEEQLYCAIHTAIASDATAGELESAYLAPLLKRRLWLIIGCLALWEERVLPRRTESGRSD